MKTSESVNELFAALAKAQGELRGALKDSSNPFFKSSYADLLSVWDACREPLSKNGLCIVQVPRSDGATVVVETRIGHSSGQWIEGELTAHAKDDGPQAIGSAITYLRRYMLQSVTGVAPEDDDGEAATDRTKQHKPTAKKPAEHGANTGEKLTTQTLVGSFRSALERADDATKQNQLREWLFSKAETIGSVNLNVCLAEFWRKVIGNTAPDDVARWDEVEKLVYADKAHLTQKDYLDLGLSLDKRRQPAGAA